METKDIVETLKNVHTKINELQTVGIQSASLLVAIADAIAAVHNALVPKEEEPKSVEEDAVIVEPEVLPEGE